MSMRWLQQNWHRVLAHCAGIGSLSVLAFNYAYGDLAIPERYVMLRSGSIGLIFLVASLACTPVSRLLGWPRLVQIRRALGLYGFAHISIHLLTYAALEDAFDFDLIWRDIGERRAMLVGLAGFLLLLPLAATSTRGWQRRLGKRWKRLHRLVYVAIALGVAHYLLLDRDFKDVPLIFALLVGILLALRLPLDQLAAKRRPPPASRQLGEP
jgi:methionine sulfoxide reductase heme-binding subunit